ncbi:hypothetical protein HYH02_000049 [Chlamydomonas schloesseri]|uniref:Queuosine 5'-phosphate N-glycosylase/hydrolase n=1 Tax=Chlamydomonas schloesseri TaxID=2026947 RepID=A0A836B7N8_9CHLO|nr:hypothetical protein HYH02_000049 [Chlamydomonas schloesseri]|eukprot:KAG2449945.1 hypothetical protein HYH02_000049 [Chlamydomonas schloesseri]
MPGAPSVLEDVHRSCAEVAALHREHVSIDDAALEALADELVAAAEDVRCAVRGLPLPIRFSSLEQELTLLALFHLLDFGSGYLAAPEARRQSGGRQWREALLYGLLGLHLGGTRLDSHKLKSFSMYDLTQVFGLDATVEVPVMPGVTMSKPGPLQPLCKSLLAALNDTGAQLAEGGHKSLGGQLMAMGEELRKAGRTSASAFVEELVDTLPAFRDSVLYDGRTLTLARRAQNLAADLAIVYGSRTGEGQGEGGGGGRFAFPDVDQLAADSGPTTIAALRAKGVLKVVDPDLAATLDSGAELPAGPHERALRAAAVVACDRLAAAANAKPGNGSSGSGGAGAAGAAGAGPGAAAEAGAGGGESKAAESGAGGTEPATTTAAPAPEASASGSAAGGGGGGDGGGDGGGSSKEPAVTAAATAAAAAPIRPVDVGAYLAYLCEPGRELEGRARPHVTLGVTAY